MDLKNINTSIENELNQICNKNYNKKNILIFAGGGFKGFVFIGVLKYFEEINILKDIDTFIGTSVGGYVAILLSIGYTYKELYTFTKLFDLKTSTNINLLNFFNTYSIDNCDNFVYTFKKLIEKKNINPDITLLELYKKTKKKVVVTTICLCSKEVEYISYENYPDMPLVTAMRMTTCVPFLYPPVKYNNKLYIDGGFLDNFPINYLKNQLNNVIGINIEFKILKTDEINNFKEYILNLIQIFFVKLESYNDDIYKNIVYNIPSFKQNPLDFNMTVKEKKQLIKDGYDYIKAHFKL